MAHISKLSGSCSRYRYSYARRGRFTYSLPGDRTRTRVVTYRRKAEVRWTPFRGGITCISNRELHGDDVLEAFKSRVLTMNYDPSDASSAR